MPIVTVYSKPNCSQCRMTKKDLTRKGVQFIEIDVTEDADAYDLIVGMGFLAAPVVEAGGEFWAGFRPDLIDKFIAANAAPADAELVAA